MSKKHARDEASPLIKRKLWIDTDCMVGRVDGNLISGRADQDDGFALVAMLHLPALFDVVGVSSVFGRSSDESSSSHSATSTKHAAKIAAMRAMKAAAEQAEAKLKTKKEKAKAAAEKATKNVLEQAMPVDVTPTKEEAAAVHICVAGLSQLPPCGPWLPACRETDIGYGLCFTEFLREERPAARDHTRLPCHVPSRFSHLNRIGEAGRFEFPRAHSHRRRRRLHLRRLPPAHDQALCGKQAQCGEQAGGG